MLVVESARAAEVRKVLDAWLQSSRPITLPMIDDMEKQIEPLQEKFKELQAALRDVDSSVCIAEALRATRLRWENEERERRERQTR